MDELGESFTHFSNNKRINSLNGPNNIYIFLLRECDTQINTVIGVFGWNKSKWSPCSPTITVFCLLCSGFRHGLHCYVFEAYLKYSRRVLHILDFTWFYQPLNLTSGTALDLPAYFFPKLPSKHTLKPRTTFSKLTCGPNPVLMEHGHTHLFACKYSCLHAPMSRMEQ